MKTVLLSASILLAGLLGAAAQPTILFEPKGQSVSPGAQAIFIVVAYGPEPISYQWFKNGVALSGQTEDALIINPVALSDAGNYTVEATSASGSITSDIAILDVDPTFMIIRSPSFVRAGGSSTGAAWSDYDKDGDLDLLICRGGLEPNQLHRNNGDGTFTETLLHQGNSRNAAWADFDNDGFPDLYVANSGADFLYRNNGDGTLMRITNSAVVAENAQTFSGAWADYDRDGFLDLVVGNSFNPNALFRNLGDGSFTSIASGPIPTEGFRVTTSPAWADFDNDNDPDLVIANGVFGGGNEILYTNNGNGTFGRSATTWGGNSTSASWADYDNDLDLDVFISNTGGQNNGLFRNNGDGTFTAVTTGEIVSDGGDSEASGWADYDNDGFIDLFVANNNGQQSFLYHNNGDGTFSRVLRGSPAGDFANAFGSAWGDYNNDGFMDLFIAKQGGNNSLYKNGGNSNAWLVVKLLGRTSNRFGVGAKVKVLATIGGVQRWQMREIGARGSEGTPSTPYAEFGLADAAVIDTLRIEWPSGISHELTNVAVRQYFTVPEPPAITIANATATEGDSGTKSMNFEVTLGDATNQVVTLEYFTSDGSAIAGADYIATNGVLTFQPGETTQTISVGLIGDLVDETNRIFFVTITNATVMPLARTVAQATLIDDDPLLMIITDAAAPEGDSGTNVAVLTVSLQKAVDFTVSVDYGTASSAATANVDYRPAVGNVTFNPGETEKFVPVALLGDLIDELNEVIFVNFSNAVNIVLVDRQGSVTIQDDDPTPEISITDVSVREGDSGTNHATFRITLSRPSSRAIAYSFASTNQTALAGSDFAARSAPRTFSPGITNAETFIVVNGDTLLESNEVFGVYLYNLTNAVAGKSIGYATILDDDHRLAPVQLGPNGVTLRFPTLPGRTYIVEWTASLNPPPSWTLLATPTGTGAPIEIPDPEAPIHPQRFYRIRLQ